MPINKLTVTNYVWFRMCALFGEHVIEAEYLKKVTERSLQNYLFLLIDSQLLSTIFVDGCCGPNLLRKVV
jgi:hypothetical protein